jgi:outer membrane protein
MSLRQFNIYSVLILWPLISIASAERALSLTDFLSTLPQTAAWQLTELNFQAAQQALHLAQATAGVTVNGTTNAGLPIGEAVANPNLSLSLNASLTLLPWASAADGIRRAERNLQRTTLERRELQNNIFIQVINKYYDLYFANLDYFIAVEKESFNREEYRMANIKYNNGQINKNDLFEIELKLKKSNIETQKSNILLFSKKSDVAQFFGDDLTALGPKEMNFITDNLETLLKKLSQSNIFQKAKIDQADAQAELTSAQYEHWLPDAKFSLSYTGQNGFNAGANLGLKSGVLSLSGSQAFVAGNPIAPAFALSAALSFPIISSTDNIRSHITTQKLAIANFNLAIAQKNAEMEGQILFNNANLAANQVEALRAAMLLAERVVTITQTRLQAGLVVQAQLNQAQLDLQQAKRDFEYGIFQLNISRIKLKSFIGEDIGAIFNLSE